MNNLQACKYITAPLQRNIGTYKKAVSLKLTVFFVCENPNGSHVWGCRYLNI